MKDKCGIDIEAGCVVDVMADGMLAAYVTEVRDGGLVGADGRTEPALLVLQIGIPMRLEPGAIAPVYVVRRSDKPKEEKPERVN